MSNYLFIYLPRNTYLQMAGDQNRKSAPDPTFYRENGSTGLAQTAGMKTNPDITPTHLLPRKSCLRVSFPYPLSST